MFLAAVMTDAAQSGPVHAPRQFDARSLDLAKRLAMTEKLPPAPANVHDLRFLDFYRLPAGRYGLEFTDKLEGLDRKTVRIVGYVIGQDTPSPGRFILSPIKVTMAAAADGPAHDLPPAVVFVTMPPGFESVDLPALPVPVVVQGTLRVGRHIAMDGQVSWVRIELDPADPRIDASDEPDSETEPPSAAAVRVGPEDPPPKE